jgi:hypothetical protein
MTAFTSATTTEAPNVSLREASAAGLVTAFQNPSSPLPVDFQITAASGIRTMKLRYPITKPRPRAAPPDAARRTGRRSVSALA